MDVTVFDVVISSILHLEYHETVGGRVVKSMSIATDKGTNEEKEQVLQEEGTKV